MMGGLLAALALIYFLASYAVPRMLVTLTKAAAGSKVSISNSRVIGETILAKADGNDKCVVDVFVMDASDKGVPGKRVSLEGIETVTPEQGLSDSSGKVSFSMTSMSEGQYTISAMVEGVTMPKTIKVTFRN